MKLSEIRQKSVQIIKSSFLSSGNESLKFQAETASLDVDLILSHFLEKDRTWILFHRDFEIDEKSAEKINFAVEKRKTGLPIAYITNQKEFYGSNFYVDESVLIPKPDTELLVDLAVDSLLDKYFSAREKGASFVPFVCDMCAGSGCVGISVLKELSKHSEIPAENLPKILFADLSLNALEIAQKNAEKILKDGLLSHVRFIQTNLFEQIPFTFDLIATNPPYVPHSESVALLVDGRSEPLLALDGDVDEHGNSSGTDDGLAIIKRLVPQSYAHLSRNGVLIMETGEYNAQETAVLFKKSGFRNVRVEFDLSQKMRDVVGVK